MYGKFVCSKINPRCASSIFVWLWQNYLIRFGYTETKHENAFSLKQELLHICVQKHRRIADTSGH